MNASAPWETDAPVTAHAEQPWLADKAEKTTTPSEDTLARLTPPGPALGDSLGQQLHAAGSSLYHGVVGGYKGIGTLVGGGDMADAAEAVNAETAKTYAAPPSDLSGVTPALRPTLEQMNQGLKPTALGDFAAEHGISPGVSTALAVLPSAAASMAGLRGKSGALKAPEAAAVTDQTAVARALEHQSMGAAAAAPDLSVAHPELREAISRVSAPHPVALERHLDTAQLPLPEGTSPLRLRKGQALGNDQQISDEKNLRADPDTQGILTDSITDQDSKLGASMGEIRRKATPEIVQRTNPEHDQAVIDAIKTQDNAAVLDTRAKYKALSDANGGTIPIDTGATIGDITQKLKKGYLTKTAQSNGVISSVMDDLDSGKPIDFESFENARSRLADVQRGGGSDGVAAGIVRDALEKMPLPESAAPLKALADVARASAKSRFDLIKENPAYAAVIDDNVPKNNGLHVIGAPSPLAGSFLDKYALGNGATAAPAFVRRLKDSFPDPIIAQSIEAAALNKLREAAGIDPYGIGSFRNASYRNAHNALSKKSEVLLSPESIEHTERLKRVSGYVNDEGKASSTNRSNTMVALQRFGAHMPEMPTLKGQLIEQGADMAAGHVLGPVGVIGKRIGQTMFKSAKEAKALHAMKDAKLKFATDATQHGAGLDYIDPADTARPSRAAGGKVDMEALVGRLMNRWKAAKRATDHSTKPLLTVPDGAIARALQIAQEHI